jgi:hypothetical protein
MNLKHAHDTITTLVAPAACQGGMADAPSGDVRLARGLNAPSGVVRLARELNDPSGEVRLARGPNAPWGEDCLARRHLHAHRPRSCPRVRAFNALTPQDARHDPDMPRNHARRCSTDSPGKGHSCHCVTLYDEAGVSPVTLCRLLLYG